MKTVSLTEARRNLTRLVRQAVNGEDVGLVCDGRIVALRAVEVYSEDYALREYGIKQEALERQAAAIRRELGAERKRGGLLTWPARKRRG